MEKGQPKGQRAARILGGLLFILIGAILAASIAFLPEIDPTKTNDLTMLFAQAHRLENTIRPPEIPEGQPVIVSGEFNVSRSALDFLGIAEGSFLALRRTVETYAFKEIAIPQSQWPPNPKPQDKYRYETGWFENPTPWRKFKVWKDHTYHEATINDELFYAENITIGRLELDPTQATYTDWQAITLDEKKLPRLAIRLHDDTYIYQTLESMSDPKPSDYRWRYDGIALDNLKPTMTVFGALDYNRIVPFKMANGREVLLVLVGDESALRNHIGRAPLRPCTIEQLGVILPAVGVLLALIGLLLVLSHRGGRKNAT